MHNLNNLYVSDFTKIEARIYGSIEIISVIFALRSLNFFLDPFLKRKKAIQLYKTSQLRPCLSWLVSLMCLDDSFRV